MLLKIILFLTAVTSTFCQFYDNIPLRSVSSATFKEGGAQNDMKNVSMSNCQIHTVDRNTFAQLVRLEEVRLDHNDITSLHASLFDTNLRLNKINLSWNKLNYVPEYIFAKLSNLEELWLHKNNIKRFDVNTFANLKALKKLVIYANELKQLDVNVFRNNINLEYLHFGDNFIVDLPESIFANMPNLNFLAFHRNKVRHLSKSIFSRLHNLQNLSIAYNEITDLDPSIFDSNVKLANVWMGGNKLVTLPAGLFKSAGNLNFLNIQGNGMTRLESIFARNSKLTKLQMSDNRLTTLDGDIIANLRELKQLEVHNNPWTCDCNLKDVYTKWRTSNTIAPVCNEPAVNKRKSWSVLTSNSFVCAKPELESSYSTIDGDSATVTCQSKSKKIEPITWQFNNQNIDASNINYQTCYTTTKDGKTQYNLLIKNVDPSVAGKYKCLIGESSNQAEKETTLNITPDLLNKINNPILSVSLSKQFEIPADFGETITASCQIYSVRKPALPTLSWSFNNQHLDSSANYKIDYSEVDDRLSWYNLTISGVSDKDSGIYFCNTKGVGSSEFKLKVNKKLNTFVQGWVDY